MRLVEKEATVKIRKLGPSDADTAMSFLNKHFRHMSDLDAELIVKPPLMHSLGHFIGAETRKGLQGIVHYFRKDEFPPFDSRYIFDVIAVRPGREGRRGLNALLATALNNALKEANLPQVIFSALCDAENENVEGPLWESGFRDPETLEVGRVILSGAVELKLPNGIQVRQAEQEDAPRVSEITVRYGNPLDWYPESHVSAMIIAGAVIVAETQGRIIAACGGQILDGETAIGYTNIAEPEYPFIGYMLFNKLCLILRSKGANFLLGAVESEKHRTYYQRIGWQHVKTVSLWKRIIVSESIPG